MLLKQCYIRGFGRLCEFTYDFTEGLNVICAENGWGKSTLAAFLRAMFYGMSQAGSRTKLEEAERRKYKPWNGGVMGGYLIFEVNEKSYKAERTFGKKEAEDTFRLIDLSTNLDSKDFSAELGKELFGLDKEAYSRSTYLPQNKIFDGGMNDSIGKKLGKMAEGEEESGSFEKACECLDELRKKYIPDRQKEEKGYVAELTRSISDTEARLAACRRKEENAVPWRKRERNASAERQRLEEELVICRKRLEEAAGYEALAAKKQHYNELCGREETLRLKLRSLKELFHAGVPVLSLLHQCCEESEEAAAISGELRSYRLDETENRELEMLQSMFSAGVPEPEELAQCIRSEKEAGEQSACANTLYEQAEEEERKAKKSVKLWRILSVILLSTAVVLCAGALLCEKKATFLFAAGMLLTVGGVISLVLCLQKVKKEARAKRQKDEQDDVLEQLLLQEKQHRDILAQCGMTEVTDVTDGLYRLTDCVRRYHALSERKESYRQCAEKKEALLARSKELLLKYGMETDDIAGNLRILENRTRDFMRFTEELAEASGKRVQFEQENPPDSFYGLTPPKIGFEELQRNERELISGIARFSEEEKDCRERAEAYESEAEEIPELEENYAGLCNRLEAKRREHFYITEAMKCLKTAKERFSTRYMNSLTTGFERYVSILGKEDLSKSMDGHFDGIMTDVNLKVQVSAYGEERELGYLSTGLRDMLGLCMRFALVDALFTGEVPVLILDDPFVNLDEEKLKRAVDFLKEASKKYQILYLVCHSSRG
ncbi:MAG: AAA family ATPase [Lachnospiraceae bacterium]|nr:AAA family ATPase [Lachnospiraceae bacterium]